MKTGLSASDDSPAYGNAPAPKSTLPSPNPQSEPMHGPRRWLNVALGLAFVGLAGLGVVLPVLPTTPFLILASACFVRASPRLNAWLLHSPLFGPMLRDWQHHRRVRRRTKHVAAALLIVAVALSAWLGQLTWPWLVALIVLALVGLAVVLRLPEKSRWAVAEEMAMSAEQACAIPQDVPADPSAAAQQRLDRDASA